MLKDKAAEILDALARRVIEKVHPKRLVVGLSGGADSTLCLLTAVRVRELTPACEVLAVHCIHGLDADDPVWLAHCQGLCKKVGVNLVTPKLHIVYGGGRSPEAVSREERYKALLSNLKGGVLMLGHQADDEAESLLLALKRGSGPRGLSGMREVTEDSRGTVIRPLLKLHKKEIEEIIDALGFDFVYDISNSYLKFERNFIRLKVLPLLRERFKGIDDAILRTSSLCALEHDLATRYAKDALAKAQDGNRLDLNKLDLNDKNLVYFVLRLFMGEYLELPPEYAQVEKAYGLCLIGPDQEGLVPLTDSLSLRRYDHYLWAVKERRLPDPGTDTALKPGQKLILGDYAYKLTEAVAGEDDARSFDPDGEVILCFDCPGKTRLKPRTRPHSRELKKLFHEYGVPYWERRSKPFIKNKAGEILAVGDLFSVGNKGGAYVLKVTPL